MAEVHTVSNLSNASLSFTVRDVVAVFFRQRRVTALCFLGLASGILLTGLLLPPKYQAVSKFLIKRERMDPVVTPEASAPIMFKDTITEEEINSEVDLMESQDVLRKVVKETGLSERKRLLAFLRPAKSEAEKVDNAVRRLEGDLQVEPIKKTNLIEVRYTSSDPGLAAAVLKSLNKFYLDKHLAVHHPVGQLAFFEEETEAYRKNLTQAEEKLKEFSGGDGGIAPQVQRDLTLQKLNEFSATLQQTRTEIQATGKRIQDLRSQAESTPGRLTTQTRKADNPAVLEQLKSALLTLELKRTELLTKYQPTYRLVQEVEKQIADTKTAIVNEQSSPIREETTDQNPTFAWIASELAKAEADLSALRAREVATQAAVRMYTADAHQLEEKGIVQQDLLRAQKTNEEGYLLYLRKREEARIADALDRNRILNIAIAQEPEVPTSPVSSRLAFALVGIVLAGVVSLAGGFAADYLDQSFRTPSEVVSELNIPVLAAVPVARRAAGGRNGFGPTRFEVAEHDTRRPVA
jgi:succinoglycan biosynthesis transport protein ExoP